MATGSQSSKSVYTIPSGAPFADVLTKGLLDQVAGNPLALTGYTLLLPTRRADVEVVISDESDELLETGGGIMKALALLGEDPFFVINGDVLWLDGPTPALQRLAGTWDNKHMDALLLLHSTVEAYGYDGRGDFMVDPEGALVRQPEREVSPYLFAGVQILQAKALAEAPAGPFSLNLIFDRAIEQGRLFGLINDGEWFHIGTAGGLSEAEGYFRQRFPGIRRR